MKNFTVFLTVALSFLATNGYAGNKMHSLGAYRVGFDEEKGMTPVEGLWGVGFSLLSEPNRDGFRTSIGVFDTEVENMHFDLDDLKKNTSDYYKGRKDWLTNIEGSKWIGEIPFEPFTTKNGAEGYRIGFKYETAGVAQSQTSYYLVCNQRIFLVKGLTALNDGKAEQDRIEQVISGFRCERDDARTAGLKTADIRAAWKRAKENKSSRLQTIGALRDFMIEYANAHTDVSATDAAKDDRYAAAEATLKRLVRKYLLNEAQADNGDVCFFAGWVSDYGPNDQGEVTCRRPGGANGCGDGNIACNPLLFGKTCLKDGDFKQSATLACNSEYKREKEKHDTEIQAELAAHPADLEALAASADKLCSSDSYRTANYGLCKSLYDRVAQINPETVKKFSGDLPPPEQIQPEDYDEVSSLADDQMKLLDQVCYADEQHTSLLPSVKLEGSDEVIDCAKLKEEALANLRALDKINESQQYISAQKGHGTCDNCSVAPEETPVENPLGDKAGFFDSTKDLANSCTQDEIKRHSCSFDDFACLATGSLLPPGVSTLVAMATHQKDCSPSSQDSCVVQAFSGLMEALWGMVKGVAVLAKDVVVGLVHDGAHAVWNGLKGVANWFGASLEIENASSYKMVQLARTSGGFLGDFIKAPGETMSKLMNGIWNAIQDWMKTDLFCQKWSGVPHFSKCEQPSTTFDCVPCKQKILGGCTAVGYIGSYFASMVASGGISSAAKAISESATVLKILAKADSIGAAVAERLPKLAKAAKVVYRATGRAATQVKKLKKFVTRDGKPSRIGKLVRMGRDAVKNGIKRLEKIPVVNLPIKIVKLPLKALKAAVRLHNQIAERSYELGRMMTAGFSLQASGTLAAKEARALAKAANKVAKADNKVQKLEAGLTPEQRKAMDDLSSARKEHDSIQAEYDQAVKNVPTDPTIAESEKALTKANQELKSTQDELDEVNRRLQKYVGNGKAGGKKLTKSRVKAAQEDAQKRKDLTAKLADQTKVRDDLQVELETKKKPIDDAYKIVDDKRLAIEAKKKEIDELQAKAGNGDKQLAKLEEAKKKLAQLRDDHAKLQLEIKNKPVPPPPAANIPPKIARKNMQIDDAQRRYDEASARVIEQRKAVEKARIDAGGGANSPSIASNLKAERAALDQAEDELKAAKKELDKREPVSARKQKSILSGLNNDLDQAKSDLQLAIDTQAKLKTKVANASRASQGDLARFQMAKQNQIDLEARIRSIETEIQTKTNVFSNQTANYEAQRKVVEAKEAEIKTREETVANLKASAKSAGKADDAIADEEKKLKKLQKAQSDRLAEIKKLEEERTQVATQLIGEPGANAMNALINTKKQIAEYDAYLSDLQSRIDASVVQAKGLDGRTKAGRAEKALQRSLKDEKAMVESIKKDATDLMTSAQTTYDDTISAANGKKSVNAAQNDRRLVAIAKKEISLKEKELSGKMKTLNKNQKEADSLAAWYKKSFGDIPPSKVDVTQLTPEELKVFNNHVTTKQQIDAEIEKLKKETEALQKAIADQKSALAKIPESQYRIPTGAEVFPLVPLKNTLDPEDEN